MLLEIEPLEYYCSYYCGHYLKLKYYLTAPKFTLYQKKKEENQIKIFRMVDKKQYLKKDKQELYTSYIQENRFNKWHIFCKTTRINDKGKGFKF